MRAITCTGYGRPTQVLHLDDVGDPPIAADHVLVDVHAASLNPADWHLIRGIPYLARLQIGLRRPSFDIPGSDFAGIVRATGPDATTFQPGDEVYGTTFMSGFGAFAEQVAVPERLLAHQPHNMSFAEAAAVPLAASTALQALRIHGKAAEGDRVLIIGASGGVGTYAVQIAKHLGTEVTAVCSMGNVELVRSLGADHTVDYTARDVTEIAERFDMIVQVAGAHGPTVLRRLLVPGGTLVQLSGDSTNQWVGPAGRVIAGRLHARRRGETITSFTVQPSRADLDDLRELIEVGALRTHIGETWDLNEVGVGLERLEAGRTRGKAVVTIASL